MKFFDDGPYIPNELILAQQSGYVLFFCGAGVSRARAELRMFPELTECLARRLKLPTSSPVYAQIFSRGKLSASEAMSYDEVYSYLFDKYSHAVIINEIKLLLEIDGNVSPTQLELHSAIWELTRFEEKKVRIITTNHDRLFELSLPPNANQGVWCGEKMAATTSPGVWYLHGAFVAGYEPKCREEIALCSASIGNLYYSNGANVICALSSAFDSVSHVVFIGYSGGDHLIRTLIDAYKLKKPAFNTGKIPRFWSFCEDKPSDIARWKTLNCTPIVSENVDRIADSIIEWANLAKKSTDQSILDALTNSVSIQTASVSELSKLNGFQATQVLAVLAKSDLRLDPDWLDAILEAQKDRQREALPCRRLLRQFGKYIDLVIDEPAQKPINSRTAPTPHSSFSEVQTKDWIGNWLEAILWSSQVKAYLSSRPRLNGYYTNRLEVISESSIIKTDLRSRFLLWYESVSKLPKYVVEECEQLGLSSDRKVLMSARTWNDILCRKPLFMSDDCFCERQYRRYSKIFDAEVWSDIELDKNSKQQPLATRFIELLVDGEPRSTLWESFCIKVLARPSSLLTGRHNDELAELRGRLAAQLFFQERKSGELEKAGSSKNSSINFHDWLNNAPEASVKAFLEQLESRLAKESIELSLEAVWPRTQACLTSVLQDRLLRINALLPDSSQTKLETELLNRLTV